MIENHPNLIYSKASASVENINQTCCLHPIKLWVEDGSHNANLRKQSLCLSKVKWAINKCLGSQWKSLHTVMSPCLCRSLPTGSMEWEEIAENVAASRILSQISLSLVSGMTRILLMVPWPFNRKNWFFFSFSALWNTLRLGTMQTIIEIVFCFAWKKLK